jgi:DeoR family ulaG and ulaABCDEF operon transcriptional repressor
VIINGGTTTFQMVYPLAGRRLQILTNSFPIAEHLLKLSKNTILLPGGTIYREQNIVLESRKLPVLREREPHAAAELLDDLRLRGTAHT